MAEPRGPDVRIFAVLVSAVPLSSALSLLLLQAARELGRSGSGPQEIAGERVHGRVWSEGREVRLGTLGGVLFEAEVETERGSGRVRFLVTRDGLEESGAPPAAPSRPKAWLS
jgi:hypothetical protein